VRIEFTLDCCDLNRMAAFWQSAAGFVVDGVIEGRYVALSGHGVVLTLQHVEEAKSVKNRMHPAPRQEFGQTWYVLADPEGNEFCVARQSV